MIPCFTSNVCLPGKVLVWEEGRVHGWRGRNLSEVLVLPAYPSPSVGGAGPGTPPGSLGVYRYPVAARINSSSASRGNINNFDNLNPTGFRGCRHSRSSISD